ncbi:MULTISPECIES: cupin domain-containing protein [unclassified Streptomyces]|uniref:cupin domain-containing protein n=1 Tax=unclassified Streptomyces TaxID=2593676 RepID=UPI0033DA976F
MRDWVAELGLEPHAEGGYFRRIYTSAHTLPLPRGPRPAATSIHYLLTRDQPLGRLHRNRSDILHFLLDGGPLEYATLAPDGTLGRVRLGTDDSRFLLVPGGHWKASRLVDGAEHGLVAEVVTPGFDYADHEFATEADLRGFPGATDALRPFLPS